MRREGGEWLLPILMEAPCDLHPVLTQLFFAPPHKSFLKYCCGFVCSFIRWMRGCSSNLHQCLMRMTIEAEAEHAG